MMRAIGVRAVVVAMGLAMAPGPAHGAATEVEASEAVAQLSNRLGAALRERCPSGSPAEMLAAIAAATGDAEIAVIAAALAQLALTPGLCDAARDAVASASQAAQLAIVSATGTAAVGESAPANTNAPPALFSVIGAGAPGGGGSTGYNGS